jgi:cytochrome b561
MAAGSPRRMEAFKLVAAHAVPARRTVLKWLHWGIIPFYIWFLFADPDALRRMGPAVFQFHSVMGLVFVTLSLIWTAL